MSDDDLRFNSAAADSRKVAILVRVFVLTLLAVLLAAPANGVVTDDAPASGPLGLSDGTVATAFDHCGDADLCPTIAYANGDVLSIYSEGAAYCQPYLLHFVRVHGPATIYEFTRTLNHDLVNTSTFGTKCGNNRATQMTLDHGLAHLTVDEYKDGSLRFIFSKV